MTRSASTVSCISGSVTDGGLFKAFLKCSDHQASHSASVVRSHPCLSDWRICGSTIPATHYFGVILSTFPCSPLLPAAFA